MKSKFISNSTKSEVIAKFSRKDWVKKLEAVSGKSIEVRKFCGTIYLIIDCSGSMADGDKMDQAKRGAICFASQAQNKGYSVGLIQFASYAEHVIEPQTKLTNFNTNIEKLTINGSTNMAAAIQMAINKLVDRTAEKIMCIVTDGMPDNEQAALDEANNAKKEKIDIMTIGTDDADKGFLEKLATRNGLSLKVSRNQLKNGIASMANLLPEK